MFSDKMKYALALLRGMGNMYYSALRHPTETTVIERETGHVFKRFRSWQEYLDREPEFPYSRYVVLGGIRQRSKPNVI